MPFKFWTRQRKIPQLAPQRYAIPEQHAIEYTPGDAPPKSQWTDPADKMKNRRYMRDPADMTNYNQLDYAWAARKAVPRTKAQAKARQLPCAGSDTQIEKSKRNAVLAMASLPKALTEEERQIAKNVFHRLETATHPGHCLDSWARLSDWAGIVRHRIFHSLTEATLAEQAIVDFTLRTLQFAEDKWTNMPMQRKDGKSFFDHYLALVQAYKYPDDLKIRENLFKQYQKNLPRLRVAASFVQMCRSKVHLNALEAASLIKMYYATLFCPHRQEVKGPLVHAALVFTGPLRLNHAELKKRIDKAYIREFPRESTRTSKKINEKATHKSVSRLLRSSKTMQEKPKRGAYQRL